MGQKKKRNWLRNERKARVREQRVTHQCLEHDKRIYSEGLSQIFKGQKPSNPLPAKQMADVARAIVHKSMNEYKKLDSDKTWIEARENWDIIDTSINGKPWVEPILAGYYAVVMWRSLDGTPIVINTMRVFYSTPQQALARGGREMPIIGLKMPDGTFEWPYYNESKGRVLAEARDRRQRRAINTINTLIGVNAMLAHDLDSKK